MKKLGMVAAALLLTASVGWATISKDGQPVTGNDTASPCSVSSAVSPKTYTLTTGATPPVVYVIHDPADLESTKITELRKKLDSLDTSGKTTGWVHITNGIVDNVSTNGPPPR